MGLKPLSYEDLLYQLLRDGRIEESEERFEGDALSAQAAAFVAAMRATGPRPRGHDGRRALELALEVGRLVRERMKRVA